jgi:hypothetical protein
LAILDVPFKRITPTTAGAAFFHGSAKFMNSIIKSESFFIRNFDKMTFTINVSDATSVVVNPAQNMVSKKPQNINVFKNVTIQDLRIEGEYRAVFISPTIEIVPVGFGGYSVVLSPKLNLTIQLGSNTRMILLLIVGENISNVTIQGGLVKILGSIKSHLHAPLMGDDYHTGFWTVYKTGIGQYDLKISNETVEKIEGMDLLRIEVIKGTAQRVAIIHEFSQPQDWRGKKFISFKWYGVASGHSWSFSIFAPDYRNQLYYEFVDNFVGWREFVLDIGKFAKVGKPDLSKVSLLEFRVFPHATFTNRLAAFRVNESWISPVPSRDVIEIYVKNAKVYSQRAVFGNIYIPFTHGIHVPMMPMTTNGSISFNIISSDNSIVLITLPDIKGWYKIISVRPNFGNLNEFDIPWSKVIRSPLFILLNIGVATISGYHLRQSKIRTYLRKFSKLVKKYRTE